MTISFYDFDQTITIRHTFGDHCIEKYDKTTKNKYESGVAHAKTNIKNSFSKQIKHDDLDHLSAIVTYHNNPDFIAGYVSVLLEKKLTFRDKYYSPDPVTAINLYTVEGIDKPFLISYLPEIGDNFQERMQELTGKNEQILFLKKVLQEQGYMEKNSVINFYDDSAANFEAAKDLEFINRYHVDRQCEKFQIITSALFKAQALESISEQSSSFLYSSSNAFFAEVEKEEMEQGEEEQSCPNF